jgi:AcrR family transcriptional regulator
LAVAATLFGRSGYARTSLSDVADAAGIQAGSLYHHFDSKEALAAEIVKAMHDDLTTSIAEFDTTAEDPVSALRAFARVVSEVSDRHRAAVLLSVFDAPANAGALLSSLVRLESPLLAQTWESLLARAGEARVVHAEVDTRLLGFALRRGTWEVGLHALTRLPPAQMADQFCATLLDGLLLEPRSADELDGSPSSAVVESEVRRWVELSASTATDRRGVVLEAGRSEFARRGFVATTMRDVAEAAEVNSAAVYRLFPSKDALLEEILGRFTDALLEGFIRVTTATTDPVEALDGLIGLMVHAGPLFSREFEIVRAWWRLEAPDAPVVALAGNRERYKLLRAVVTDGLAGGVFRSAADVDLYTTCIRELLWMPFDEAGDAAPTQVRAFLRTTMETGALRA